MGNARWKNDDWDRFVSSQAGRSRGEIFSRNRIDPDLDPRRIKVRESRDSPANPNATPIIIASDVTGSMGALAEVIIRQGLGTIMQEIYDRKPVPDPQIMCMAIGDTYCDEAPLQATQFEADLVLADQLSRFYLEGGGGANEGESYTFPWWFAANMTSCDAFEKHGRKGYLFTIGDEAPLPVLPRSHVMTFAGREAGRDLSAEDLLAQVTRNWEVFHLMVKPVSHQAVQATWRRLLGERAIMVRDQNRLAEVIVSAIQINEGASASAVVKSWGGNASTVVSAAVGALPDTAATGRWGSFGSLGVGR